MNKSEQNKIIVDHYSEKKYQKIDAINFLEDCAEANHLGFTPWKKYAYKPDVNFKIGYTDQSILLKVFVQENYIKAKYNQANDPVYRDSCFEFFISLDNENSYYNFEFNCIGTPYLAYGKPGNNREKVNIEIINSIQTFSTLGNKTFEERKGDFSWELNINIPYSAFFKHDLKSLEGKTCGSNFYKCGDDLSLTHFVTWNNIDTKEPDFHRPKFFGKLTFE